MRRSAVPAQQHGGPQPPGPSRPPLQYAPPGSRFDELARTPLHRWWRPLLGTLVLVCAYWVLQPVLGMPLMLAIRRILGPNSVTVAFVMGLPAALLAARWVQRRPIGSLSSVAGHLRHRWVLVCAGAAVGYLIVLFIAYAALLDVSSVVQAEGAGWVGWQRFLVTAAVVLPIVPFEAAAQEYVFRGWLLQAFGAYVRSPWPGIVLSSVLFSLIHPAAYQSLWAIAFYSLFGIVFAFLTVHTGGLEAALALHTIHNWAFLLPAVATGLATAPAPAQPDWAAVPWPQLIAAEVLPLTAFAALVLWLAQRRSIATTTATNRPAISQRARMVHR